jgi:predicted NUDIX family NTP pyrophosphohydrolase
MPAVSAGLLVHRRRAGRPREVLLVHPGGPFWAKKDDGAWSIPKGEVDPSPPATGQSTTDLVATADLAVAADLVATADREFAEELGQPAPAGDHVALGEVVQAGGKHVVAWAVEGDVDPTAGESNRFEMEWPPRSGRVASFPEVDRAEWFTVADARRKLVAAQVELVDRLIALVD